MYYDRITSYIGTVPFFIYTRTVYTLPVYDADVDRYF